MKHSSNKTFLPALALTFTLLLAAAPAQAQSNEGVIGGLIGGTVGSVVGGKLDNRGSSSDGKIVGALVGGSIGYIIGDGLNDDDKLRSQYSNQPGGVYYTHKGKPYRRYADRQYGYVYVPITNQDRYYYSNGRRKHVVQNSRHKSRSVRYRN